MDALIEQCTSESLLHDKWDIILRVCEEYGSTQPKACLKSICKRIFQKNSNISLRAITLLDACSKNCGKPFNREIASREFTQTVKSRFTNMSEIPRVKLAEVFEKWKEEFQSDSELALAASLYSWVKSEHGDVIRRLNEDRQATSSGTKRTTNYQLQAKEEEELAKAIALSLKESDMKRPTDQTPPRTRAQPQVDSQTNAGAIQPRTANGVSAQSRLAPAKGRVRALYDFEAAEDNELTFKAGEVIILLDDSDENWWRGSNHRGEGLFPAQFVKRDDGSTGESAAEVKPSTSQSATIEPQTPVVLDPAKIDECLQLINTVDPTGEYRPDPVELPRLEAECNAMAPLIYPVLGKVDKQVLLLSELNQRLLDAFQMYHDLMSQTPAPVTTGYYNPGVESVPGGTAYAMPSSATPGFPGYGPAAYGSIPIPPNMQATSANPYAMSENMYSGHPSVSHYTPSPAYPPSNQPQLDGTAQGTKPTETRQPYAMSDIYAGGYQASQSYAGQQNAQPMPNNYAAGPPPLATDGRTMALPQQQAPYYYGYGQPTDGLNFAANGSHPDGTPATAGAPTQPFG